MTEKIGSKIIRLETVDSTNNYILKYVEKTIENDGLVVVTNDQTQGKGQHENVWISEKGKNLTFSFIFFPSFIKSENQFVISKAIALAVSDFVNSFNIESKIKWPNDIYVNEKKISGILIENSLFGQKIFYTIAGIGININQKIFNKEAGKPTSIFNITSVENNIENAIDSIIKHLNKYYNLLYDNQFRTINELYHNRLFGLNEKRNFLLNSNTVSGIILGVDEIGKIKIQLDDSIILFDHSEIKFIL